MKVGFVAILGPTNAGKSTLLNALIGEKVSVVSPKVQTTYHGIKGVLTTNDAQIVFTDTPGYQDQRGKLPGLLNQVADRCGREADLLVWVLDVSSRRWRSELDALSRKIKSSGKKSICVLNKVDRIPKPLLLPWLAELDKLQMFDAVIPISAKKGDGVDRILNAIVDRLPEGTPLYPEDVITDRNLQFLVAERIREKIYETTGSEVPYSVWVEIESWEENQKGMPVISAVLHVDAESRKAILIGKHASKLKEIGMRAREDVEKLLGKKICLKIFVKVEEGWKKDERFLHAYLELQ